MVMFYIGNRKNQRRISEPHIIYDKAHGDSVISGSHYLINKTAQTQMI